VALRTVSAEPLGRGLERLATPGSATSCLQSRRAAVRPPGAHDGTNNNLRAADLAGAFPSDPIPLGDYTVTARDAEGDVLET
jgi:hypothetical protein